MKFTLENADANQTRITNQCIELMSNFKASNGLLYVKSADRTNINFIFQPSKDSEVFEEEKRKAELEWFKHLLNMVKTEVDNVESTVDEDSVTFSFNVKQGKKSRGQKHSA